MKTYVSVLVSLLFLLTANLYAAAKRDSIEKLPFSNPQNKNRSGYYYIPSNVPSKGMPILVLFHGFKDNGYSLTNTFKPFAKQHGFAIVAPDAAGDQWRVPLKGKSTSDTAHVNAALSFIKSEVSKIDKKHVGAFGHSFGARMSSTYGTNTSGVTKTAISHGRFLPSSLGGSPTAFWMSGSPKDNQFSFKVMQEQVKEYNATYRKYWPGGGARLHTYDCGDCRHFPHHQELKEFTDWFLK